MKFYLGTHETSWLERSHVPLFISHRRLALRRSLPVARSGWALDSGGFTELSTYGEWRTSPAAYAAAVRRYHDHIGLLEWCAPQDWMCEPWIVAKTGLSVAQHQARTVESFLALRSQLGEIVIPVLQGYELGEYVAHLDAYRSAGVDLAAERLTGIGSVCRRQSTMEIAAIIAAITDEGIALHGFGIKTEGLRRVGHLLASADSMAWSYAARNRPVHLDGCPHQKCSNCYRWALRWRNEVISAIGASSIQGVLL